MRSGSGSEASVVSRVLARMNMLSTPTASTRNGMTCRVTPLNHHAGTCETTSKPPQSQHRPQGVLDLRPSALVDTAKIQT